MTDKRFNYHYDGFGAYYLCDKEEGTYEDSIIGEIWADKSDMVDLVNLLNKLHEESQDLKSFNKDLAENLSACANARISKDNRIKRLKEKIQRERTSFTKTHERWSKEAETKIKELSEENEQLKKSIKRQQSSNNECAKLIKEQQKENEQLKTKNFAYLQDIEVFKEENTHLKLDNEQLKQDNNALIHLLENQSMIIQELHSKLLEYQVKEPIVLTKEDLELMGKAISYYTHGRCGE